MRVEVFSTERGKVCRVDFDSFAECKELLAKVDGHWSSSDDRDEWQGGGGKDATVRRIREGGDESLAQRAQEYLDKLPEVLLETTGGTMGLGPVGGAVAIPVWQAGAPACRFTVRPVTDNTGPLSILFDTVSACGIPADALASRGAAILALATALKAVRPVELRLLSSGGASGWTISASVPVQVDNLAEVSAVLVDPGFTRGFLYALFYTFAPEHLGKPWYGQWPWGHTPSGNDQAEWDYKVETMRQVANRENFDADELLIPPITLHDPLQRDPVGWITDNLQKYGAQG